MSLFLFPEIERSEMACPPLRCRRVGFYLVDYLKEKNLKSRWRTRLPVQEKNKSQLQNWTAELDRGIGGEEGQLTAFVFEPNCAEVHSGIPDGWGPKFGLRNVSQHCILNNLRNTARRDSMIQCDRSGNCTSHQTVGEFLKKSQK